MLPLSLSLVAFAAAAQAQELYMTRNGTSARPQCTDPASSPSYHFQPFSYTLNETVRYVLILQNSKFRHLFPLLTSSKRYATSVPAPTTTKTYAPGYTKAAKALGTSLSTTTWGNWLPGQTAITATDSDDPYGQAAWSSMWQTASLHNYVSLSRSPIENTSRSVTNLF